MMRTMAISGLILMLLALASCGKEKNVIELNHSFGSKNVVQSGDSNERKSVDSAKGNPLDLQAGVIAKSGNAVSSNDKEEVIKQLDKQLDSLFMSINESKDVGEKDLGDD